MLKNKVYTAAMLEILLVGLVVSPLAKVSLFYVLLLAPITLVVLYFVFVHKNLLTFYQWLHNHNADHSWESAQAWLYPLDLAQYFTPDTWEHYVTHAPESIFSLKTRLR